MFKLKNQLYFAVTYFEKQKVNLMSWLLLLLWLSCFIDLFDSRMVNGHQWNQKMTIIIFTFHIPPFHTHTHTNHKCMLTDEECRGGIIRLVKISSMFLEVSNKW